MTTKPPTSIDCLFEEIVTYKLYGSKKVSEAMIDKIILDIDKLAGSGTITLVITYVNGAVENFFPCCMLHALRKINKNIGTKTFGISAISINRVRTAKD
ncbi:MAG: hypothetical protein J6B63_06100 [Treponema sp.]|nr:hypothetical protein [Treponema sp.]